MELARWGTWSVNRARLTGQPRVEDGEQSGNEDPVKGSGAADRGNRRTKTAPISVPRLPLM